MQSYLSYSSKTYRLYVDFLFIGLLLLVVSCNCRNTPLNQRGTKNNNSEETNPTRAHLVLSSDKSNLENEQINFIVFVKNEGASMANLPDYHWKINLQEEGGTGSTLAYMDANNTLQPILSSQQPFPNFLQQEALKKSDPTLGIPFQLQPAPDVKKITITLVLEHQRNEDQVSPLIISWHSLVPITDAMIQLARSKGFTSLADTLSKLQRREVINVNAPIDGANTALHVAAELGDITIFNALLERGAGINIKGTYATTPLHYAAQYGRIAITQKLIG